MLLWKLLLSQKSMYLCEVGRGWSKELGNFSPLSIQPSNTYKYSGIETSALYSYHFATRKLKEYRSGSVAPFAISSLENQEHNTHLLSIYSLLHRYFWKILSLIPLTWNIKVINLTIIYCKAEFNQHQYLNTKGIKKTRFGFFVLGGGLFCCLFLFFTHLQMVVSFFLFSSALTRSLWTWYLSESCVSLETTLNCLGKLICYRDIILDFASWRLMKKKNVTSQSTPTRRLYTLVQPTPLLDQWLVQLTSHWTACLPGSRPLLLCLDHHYQLQCTFRSHPKPKWPPSICKGLMARGFTVKNLESLSKCLHMRWLSIWNERKLVGAPGILGIMNFRK